MPRWIEVRASAANPKSPSRRITARGFIPAIRSIICDRQDLCWFPGATGFPHGPMARNDAADTEGW
jgi:hypothetical protein